MEGALQYKIAPLTPPKLYLVPVNLLSFYFGGSKLIRFLGKTEHNPSKLFYFCELMYIMPSRQKLGIILLFRILYMSILAYFENQSLYLLMKYNNFIGLCSTLDKKSN